ncbi:DinB family protein [Streptomyces sp. ISL-10]|uniref:DinB family protein n=1 Tax=Streptomyces sp. ISL-10 TaxID=2819172 RepID=UPI001BE5AFEF|nr:DinB family protein [Streptomyces sp. ISL-10]MBT2370052.1 DinB family protein [Streptomyces sp. ISL-10]
MTILARTEPSTTATERAMLDGWLDYHRETLITKCAGLSDEQLRTASVEPSTLTLMGLVRHLADVERWWFRQVMAGEDLDALYYSDEDPDGDFRVSDETTWDRTLADWRAEVAAARTAAAGRGLDDLSEGKTSGNRTCSLRWIITHMIEEYARHNGHADLLRERIDGVTGE